MMEDKAYADSVEVKYVDEKTEGILHRKIAVRGKDQERWNEHDNQLKMTIKSRTFRGLNIGWEWGGDKKIVEDLGEGYVLDLILEKPDSYLWSKIMPVLRDVGWGCYISEHTASCFKKENIGNPSWGLYHLTRLRDLLASLNNTEDALCPLDNRLLGSHCSCRKYVCEKHDKHCKYCDTVMCNTHTYSCKKCSGAFCTQHIANCDLCETLYCVNDLEICCNCSAVMCRRCYKTVKSGLLNREQFMYCKKCVTLPKESLQKRQIPGKEELIINRRAQQRTITTPVPDMLPAQFANMIIRKVPRRYIEKYGAYANDAFEVGWKTNRGSYLIKLKSNFVACPNKHEFVELVLDTGNLICPVCNTFLFMIPITKKKSRPSMNKTVNKKWQQLIENSEDKPEEREMLERFAESGVEKVVDTYFWSCCEFIESYAKNNNCYDSLVQNELGSIKQLGWNGAMEQAKSGLASLIERILKQS